MSLFERKESDVYLPICRANLLQKLIAIYCPSRKLAGEVSIEDEFTFQDLHNVTMWMFNIPPKEATFYVLNFHFESYFRSSKSQYQPRCKMKVLPYCWSVYENWPGSVYAVLLDMRNFSMRHTNEETVVLPSVPNNNRTASSLVLGGNITNVTTVEKERVFYDTVTLNELGTSCTSWISHQKFLADAHFTSLGPARQIVYTTAAADVYPQTVDNSLMTEIFSRALKHGKLMKYITSRDAWKEEYFIMDAHRLWFFVPLVSSTMSPSKSNSSTSSSPSASSSSGSNTMNAASSAVSSTSFGNNYYDVTNMSFIDLDRDSDVTTSDTSEASRFFSGPNKAQQGAQGCVFTITYNQNTSFITLKAANRESVLSWKRIIGMGRLPPSRRRTTGGPLSSASQDEDAYESIMRAEECIEANSDCTSSHDFHAHYDACSFVGMLENRFIRNSFYEFLLAEPGTLKLDANLFRFWCYVEDFRRGHPMSKQAFAFVDAPPTNRMKSTPKKAAASTWRQSLWGASTAAVGDGSESEDASDEEDFAGKDPNTPITDQDINMVHQWTMFLYYAFLGPEASQPLSLSAKQCTVVSTLLSQKLDNLVTTVSAVIINLDALPPVNLFQEIQDVVLLMLSCCIYPRFVKQPNYRRQVLLPAIHASQRLSADKDIMSSVKDLDIDGSHQEYLEDYSGEAVRNGSSPARRSSMVPIMGRRATISPPKPFAGLSPKASTSPSRKPVKPTNPQDRKSKRIGRYYETPWRRGMPPNSPFGQAFDAQYLVSEMKETLYKSLDYTSIFGWLPHAWFQYIDYAALERHIDFVSLSVCSDNAAQADSFNAWWGVADVPSLLHIRPPSLDPQRSRSLSTSTSVSELPEEEESEHDPTLCKGWRSTSIKPTPTKLSSAVYQTLKDEELQLQTSLLLNLKNFPFDNDTDDELINPAVCSALDMFMKGISPAVSLSTASDGQFCGVWSQRRVAAMLNLIDSIRYYYAVSDEQTCDTAVRRRSILHGESLKLNNHCGREKLLNECYKLNTALLQSSYGISLRSHHTLLGNVVLMTTMKCRYFPNATRYSGSLSFYVNSTVEVEKVKTSASGWLLNGLSNLPVANRFSNMNSAGPTAANPNPNNVPSARTPASPDWTSASQNNGAEGSGGNGIGGRESNENNQVASAGDHLTGMHAAAVASSNSATVNKLLANEDISPLSQAWSSESNSNFTPSACRMGTCVLVEWKGRGKIYVYDSTLSLHPFSVIELDNVSRISSVQFHLHGIELFDAYGLAWQFFPNGVDEDDTQKVTHKWLHYLSLYTLSPQQTAFGSIPINGTEAQENVEAFTERAKQAIASYEPLTRSCVVMIRQQGVLSKKGNFNTAYKKRYFVLDSLGKLRYYKEETGQLKGEINMKDVLEVGCNALFPLASIAAAAVAFSGDDAADIGKRGLFSSMGTQNNSNANMSKVDKDRSFYVRTQERLWSFQANTSGDAARWVFSLKNSLK